MLSLYLVAVHCSRQRQGPILAALAIVTLVTAASAEFVGECSKNPVNLTEPLDALISQHGVCEPYRGGAVLCDPVIETDVDYIYIPYSRGSGDQAYLISQINFANLVVETVPEKCREVTRKLMCAYYFIPCSRNGTLIPPEAICEDECTYLSTELCPNEWEIVLQHFSTNAKFYERVGLGWANCSNPGKILEPLPHCCSSLLTLTNSSYVTNNSPIIITSVVGGGGLLLVSITVLVIILCLCHVRSHNRRVNATHIHLVKNNSVSLNMYRGTVPRVTVEDRTVGYKTDPRILGPNQTGVILRHLHDQRDNALARVPSGYIRQMSEGLLIPHKQLQLMDCIGQGEFGVVYRAKWTGKRGEMAEIVAVKTLKALFNQKDIYLLMEESVTMKKFSHCNVLNLIGVCVDNGPVPLLVLPFMANGSLLKYLKRERSKLTVTVNSDKALIDETQCKLLSMCLQIAKGMEYLAAQKFIHRDLAARNCMIDEHGVIKVADFGLSEDIYLRNYFRQGRDENAVKLPVKWMALESLQDGVFNEKTDIWSFGVVCWEIFSLGMVPYPGLDPSTIVKYLTYGNRLEKPCNASCSEEIFSLILSCWNEVIDERPTFSNVVTDSSCILASVAGYIDFNLIQIEAGKEMTPNSYDHLESVAPNQVAASVQEEETAHSCTNAEEREESDNKLMVDRQAYDHLS